jgi:hypothetical protein
MASLPSKALLVGIDKYQWVQELSGCEQDAQDLADLLRHNDDGSPNYECRILPNAQNTIVSRVLLRKKWLELFKNFDGNIVFYFSGHGIFSDFGGYLLTQDGSVEDPGLAMFELLQLANDSSAREVLLILDCCHSGALGDLSTRRSGGINQAQIREGVTILAASRPSEAAKIVGGRSIFTSILLTGLRGAASDIRGYVSAASLYAFVEQSMGAFDQRPLYKSYAVRLSPVRRSKPDIEDSLLREIITYFPLPDSQYPLDPTYEVTHPTATPEHVSVFNKFKVYRNARLLRTVSDPDLYWAAINSTASELTEQGKAFRKLVADGRI